ncbi:MAG TPA: hypothetical protein VF115_12090 [Acidimicrobiia bacterium]
MWESRTAPLSGVLFAVLLIASFLVDSNTDYMPPADEIVAHLTDGPMRVMSAAYLRLLAAAALIWFSGSLHKTIRGFDDDSGRLSLLAFGGGVLAAALIAMGAAAVVAAAERVWMVEMIDSGAAAALYDMAGIAIGNGAPLGLGVMIGAAGIARIRTKAGSPWIGWSSVGIGFGLLSPYAWVVLALALIWISIAGLWMYREQSDPVPVKVS